MIKLRSIATLVRGKVAGIGAEEVTEMVAELAAGFGMDLDVGPVALDRAEETFHQTAAAALKPDARIFSLRGKMKSGDTLEGVIVLGPLN